MAISLAVFVGQASNSQLLPFRQLPPHWLVFAQHVESRHFQDPQEN
jgi:hypothetical protein